MATIEDLHKFISHKYREYCAADPIREAPYRMRVPFQDWEAEFFMRGLELGLFDVTPSDGIIVYATLGGETKKNFFDPRGAGNCREAVTQFAAITQLIEEYGYPVESVLAESVKKDQAARYALDALVFDGPRQERGAVRVAMEAKVQAGQMNRLMRQLDKCCQMSLPDKHVHTVGERPDHAKYTGILAWKPAYLWVVCPTGRAAYSVRQVSKTSFSLEPVDDIPKFHRQSKDDALTPSQPPRSAARDLAETLKLESNTRTNQAGIEFVQRPAMIMKRCPQCNRTYSDGSFSFCLEDGALLSPSYDPDATQVIPAPPPHRSPTPRKWDEHCFLADASARLSAEHLQALRSLFEWAKANADNHDLSFGRGVIGSFNPKVAAVTPRRSVFTARTDGTLTLNFGWPNEPEAAKAWRELFGKSLHKEGFLIPEKFSEHVINLPNAEWVPRVKDLLRILSTSVATARKTAEHLGYESRSQA